MNGVPVTVSTALTVMLMAMMAPSGAAEASVTTSDFSGLAPFQQSDDVAVDPSM